MLAKLLDSMGGRKFTFAITAGGGLTILLLLDKLTGQQFVDATQVLMSVYLGATALQEGAVAIANRSKEKDSS